MATNTERIDKGQYKILGMVCISMSLYKLSSGTEKPDSIHKALLQNGSKLSVAYFIDPIDFGTESTILIHECTAPPLLSSTCYTVVHSKKYSHPAALIEKLLCKGKEALCTKKLSK
ncbi:hypothetical protein HK407_05g10050 [Ordospora pajunii]|uniref:uncharacterized protein n=1 Tax=Ordospora pajunii TaxID=3039483 RepID=UPI002952710B|nr:uncharacterized protein HK407_05g10050 [Ordospora pajunii]KAH9411339.1 hypothetical protein HK407_05g10050 [Ordospora pajunii]